MTIEAMKLALEALKGHNGNHTLSNKEWDTVEAAITALRQAIEQDQTSCYCPNCEALSKQLEQEPVAYVGKSQFERLMGCGLVTTSLTVHKAFPDDIALHASPLQNQPEQEPVLIVDKEPDYMSRGNYYEGTKPHIDPTKIWRLPVGTKLYTSPPQRQPLTDEEIAKCYETTGHYQTLRPQDRFAVFALARAIEAKLKEKNHDA